MPTQCKPGTRTTGPQGTGLGHTYWEATDKGVSWAPRELAVKGAPDCLHDEPTTIVTIHGH